MNFAVYAIRHAPAACNSHAAHGLSSIVGCLRRTIAAHEHKILLRARKIFYGIAKCRCSRDVLLKVVSVVFHFLPSFFYLFAYLSAGRFQNGELLFICIHYSTQLRLSNTEERCLTCPSNRHSCIAFYAECQHIYEPSLMFLSAHSSSLSISVFDISSVRARCTFAFGKSIVKLCVKWLLLEEYKSNIGWYANARRSVHTTCANPNEKSKRFIAIGVDGALYISIIIAWHRNEWEISARCQLNAGKHTRILTHIQIAMHVAASLLVHIFVQARNWLALFLRCKSKRVLHCFFFSFSSIAVSACTSAQNPSSNWKMYNWSLIADRQTAAAAPIQSFGMAELQARSRLLEWINQNALRPSAMAFCTVCCYA